MNKIKHYKGVSIELSSTKGRVRTLGASRRSLKVGHGCKVKIGMLEFNSEYSAKQFIRSLERSEKNLIKALEY